MKKNNYIWANDLNENSGEGILGRLFLKEILLDNNQYLIETPYKKKLLKKKKINLNFPINNSFYFKYIYPIIGAVKVRFKKHRYSNLYYINFLPLWNFLIFIILPKDVKLGPITGRSLTNKYGKKNFILSIFYKISIFIIKKKFNSAIFSTSILKRYIKTKKNFFFDFVLLLYPNFLPIKSYNKSIDILIYNRIHTNKSIVLKNEILKKLTDLKIYCVGDKIKIPGVKNFGFISRKKVIHLMKKSKTIVSTTENLYSIFVLDGLHHGCKVITKSIVKNSYFDKENFIQLKDLKNKKVFQKKIEDKIYFKENKKFKYLKKNYQDFKNKNFYI